MTQQLIIYPLLLQLFISILLMFFWRRIDWQRGISIVGSTVVLAVAIWVFYFIWNNGVQTVQAGSWQAPFGITFA
ncbi:MAG: Na+/H+ antiporter subunit D, partial [Salegentibacter sp.]